MSLAADQQLARILGSGKLSGAFFFHGGETRLRDEAARRLAEAALDPAMDPAVFQVTDVGISIGATAEGFKFSVDDELN